MSPYFPKFYERFSGSVKVELDLSHSARKANVEKATSVNISN